MIEFLLFWFVAIGWLGMLFGFWDCDRVARAEEAARKKQHDADMRWLRQFPNGLFPNGVGKRDDDN